MPCVYTQWVDAHCCLHLLPIWNFRGFNWTEENVENVFLNYDRSSHGLLLSQRLIASHPQQDIGKDNKKNWFYKILGPFSRISHLLFLLYATRIITINIKPKSVIRPQCSKILAILLFPNIFYFLVGILPVFVTWRNPLRLRYKYSQSTRQ